MKASTQPRAKHQPVGECFDNVLSRGKRYYRDSKEFMMIHGNFTWSAEPVPYDRNIPNNAILYQFTNGKWNVA